MVAHTTVSKLKWGGKILRGQVTIQLVLKLHKTFIHVISDHQKKFQKLWFIETDDIIVDITKPNASQILYNSNARPD